MSIFRTLWDLTIEPKMTQEEVLIPEDPDDVDEDVYLSPDEGDQGHQDQLDRELGLNPEDYKDANKDG